VVIGPSTSVGGTNDMANILANHMHKGVDAPEFPAIDTDAFKAFATNTYRRQHAGQYPHPRQHQSHVQRRGEHQGVLYIETPNKVTFNGNANIQGVIVTQNNPGRQPRHQHDQLQGQRQLHQPRGDAARIVWRPSQADWLGLLARDLPPPSPAASAPSVARSSPTRSASAATPAAPSMGSIVALTNNSADVSGSSEIIIASTGTTDYPAGVYFSSRYAPLADTYEEVKP
jgi:hypothetical protein